MLNREAADILQCLLGDICSFGIRPVVNDDEKAALARAIDVLKHAQDNGMDAYTDDLAVTAYIMRCTPGNTGSGSAVTPRQFASLEALGNWIFSLMKGEYSDPKKGWLRMSFPVGSRPEAIMFKPETGGTRYMISRITDLNGNILFADGTLRFDFACWTEGVREWCRKCSKRQYAGIKPVISTLGQAEAEPHAA